MAPAGDPSKIQIVEDGGRPKGTAGQRLPGDASPPPAPDRHIEDALTRVWAARSGTLLHVANERYRAGVRLRRRRSRRAL